MTVAEIVSKFRQYIDEPDQTFISDDDVNTYLDDGYREFRNMVCDINPVIYNVTANITLSNAISHDLAAVDPKLLGETVASSGRLVRLNTIVKRRGSDGRIMERLEAVSNEQALDVVPCSYYLANTVLRFSSRLTGTYEVNYVPEVNLTWAGGGADTFIDNLSPFHDLIALLAYRQYAIVNNAESEPILRQASTRMSEFREYLQARAYDGYDYIQTVPWYS